MPTKRCLLQLRWLDLSYEIQVVEGVEQGDVLHLAEGEFGLEEVALLDGASETSVAAPWLVTRPSVSGAGRQSESTGLR